MSELAAILSAIAESQWPPSIIVGLVLYWAIDQRFKRTEEKNDARFKEVDGRFKALDEKMDTRFQATDEKMEAGFKAVDVRFNAQDQRLDRIEDQLGAINDQGTQNSIKTAVLEERMRWLEPETSQRRAEPAEASASEVAVP